MLSLPVSRESGERFLTKNGSGRRKTKPSRFWPDEGCFCGKIRSKLQLAQIVNQKTGEKVREFLRMHFTQSFKNDTI
jgi:hypothetical protein